MGTTGAGKETTPRSQGHKPGEREARGGSGSTPASPTASAAHADCGARPGFLTGGRGARRKASWQPRWPSSGGGGGGKGRGRNGRKGRRWARSAHCLIGTASSVPLLPAATGLWTSGCIALYFRRFTWCACAREMDHLVFPGPQRGREAFGWGEGPVKM
jgi:hypothetical protein